MTRDDLSKLYFLRKEIEEQKRKIQRLREYATAFQRKTENSANNPNIYDPMPLYVSEILDMEARLQSSLERKIRTEKEITDFIESTEDPLIKLIMTYRFVYNYSWVKTAWRVGGEQSEDCLKKRLERFLKKRGIVESDKKLAKKR